MKNLKYAILSLLEKILNPNKNKNYIPGVVLTFDDDFTENWLQTNQLLSKFNWKATFFVTRFNQLSKNNLNELMELKKKGHEIAGHGLNHLNTKSFLKEHTVTEYIDQEIQSLKNLMQQEGLPITSFAYPYGARNKRTDKILFKSFQMLRGTTYRNTKPKYQNCYYEGKKIVNGIGIDNNYSHFSIPFIISLLEYAKNNNKILILYAHNPVEKVVENYQTEHQTLIEICKFIKDNDMKFYTISELFDF